MKKISLLILMSSVSVFTATAQTLGQTPEQLAQVREMQEKNAKAALARYSVNVQGPAGSLQGTAQQPNQGTTAGTPGIQTVPGVVTQGIPVPGSPLVQGAVPQAGQMPFGETSIVTPGVSPVVAPVVAAVPTGQPLSQGGVVASPQGVEPIVNSGQQGLSQPSVVGSPNQAPGIQGALQPQGVQALTPQGTVLTGQTPMSQLTQGAPGSIQPISTQLQPPPPLPDEIANVDGGTPAPTGVTPAIDQPTPEPLQNVGKLPPEGPVVSSTTPDGLSVGPTAPIAPEPLAPVQQVKAITPEPTQEPQLQSNQQFGDRSEKKCSAVCSKYTQYYYLSLIASVCDRNTFLGQMIQGKISRVSPEIKQCSIESLLPEFNGQNKAFKSQAIFPGTLTSQEFYTTCYTECYKGPGDKIFSPTNPILVKFGQFYDTTRDNKHDAAFSAILLGGDDAFSTDAPTVGVTPSGAAG